MTYFQNPEQLRKITESHKSLKIFSLVSVFLQPAQISLNSCCTWPAYIGSSTQQDVCLHLEANFRWRTFGWRPPVPDSAVSKHHLPRAGPGLWVGGDPTHLQAQCYWPQRKSGEMTKAPDTCSPYCVLLAVTLFCLLIPWSWAPTRSKVSYLLCLMRTEVGTLRKTWRGQLKAPTTSQTPTSMSPMSSTVSSTCLHLFFVSLDFSTIFSG